MTGSLPPTYVDRLRAAAQSGDSGVIVMHTDDGTARVDARQLYDLARVRAAVLRSRGAGAGTHVAIAGPNAPEWFAWTVAVWMVGGTAIPWPIPIRVRDRAALAAQFAAYADAFDCRLVAAHHRYESAVPAGLAVPWESAADGYEALADDEMIVPDADSTAVIRMTSGSTAVPKGVARNHRANSATSLEVIMRSTFDEVRNLTSSPCAHGGGFLGVFAPLHPWLELHLLSPERFARDPARLFRIVGEERINTMSMMSSGVSAVLRAIARAPGDLDLSSLEWLTLSFEMVDPDVVEQLIEVGGRFGLRADVVTTFYGLAEGGWTKTQPGERIKIDDVDLEQLVTAGVAAPAQPGRPSKRVVSCGKTVGMELRIAGDDGPRSERQLGEIQFRGPLLMQGYEGATDESPFDNEGWMGTGDIGYLADGELFVTGRNKEVLVQLGRKYHPEDIEWAAANAAGVDRGAVVAFAPLGSLDGDITVAIETDSIADVAPAVRAAVLNTVGVTVRTVLTVAPGSLPKASTGKTQRLAARELFG